MTTGKEYAARPTIDAPTYYGMREAMLDALRPFKGDHPEPVTRANILRALHNACYSNPYLKAAGTQEVVDRYFQSIVAKATDADLQKFIGTFSQKDLDQIDAALKNNGQLAADLRADIAAHGDKTLNGVGTMLNEGLVPGLEIMGFTGAAKSCFKMKTFTDSFVDYLADAAKPQSHALDGVQVTPGFLVPSQIKELQDMDYVFRWLDKRDPPQVAQHIGPIRQSDWMPPLIDLQHSLEAVGLATDAKDVAAGVPDGVADGKRGRITDISVAFAEKIIEKADRHLGHINEAQLYEFLQEPQYQNIIERALRSGITPDYGDHQHTAPKAPGEKHQR